MLALHGASYRYAGYARTVIHDVDLALGDGEIVGLVGANEAGKSTICLVASGLAPASIGGGLTGTLTIDGQPAAGRPVYELAELVAIGFQNPTTQRSGVTATVFEEVALGPMNLGLPVDETVARARHALEVLRLEALAERDPARLSGGQSQLVAIASLIAMRPRHIVLDEPTAQLDPEGTRLVGEALRALAAAGTALLVAEHKTDLLDGLCDRVVVVSDGRIVLDGPAGAVLADERLAELGRRGAVPRAPDPGARCPGSRPIAVPRSKDRAMIELEGLSFVYPGGTRAVDGVDLRIAEGERVAIVGQNGSGKSTLVRHLNGLLRPTEGRVLIDGVDAVGQRVAHLAARVGLVFQDPDHQIFAGRVRAEVAFGPTNLGLGRVAVEAAVGRALETVGLADARDTNPYDLGYSRRKLLALASVLAMETPILVLDEPTTGQDARGISRIARVVADVSASGRTVIAISHDMRFVAETFARVVVMRAGRIVLDGTPAEVFAEAHWPTLASTYLEPPLAARVGARAGVGSTPTEESLLAALGARA